MPHGATCPAHNPPHSATPPPGCCNCRPDEGYRRTVLRRRYGSQYMDHEDIEFILHMQWRPLHQGIPYQEDYYYQAFVFKHYKQRNRRQFAPESGAHGGPPGLGHSCATSPGVAMQQLVARAAALAPAPPPPHTHTPLPHLPCLRPPCSA